jgi:hypothetical protein
VIYWYGGEEIGFDACQNLKERRKLSATQPQASPSALVQKAGDVGFFEQFVIRFVSGGGLFVQAFRACRGPKLPSFFSFVNEIKKIKKIV